MTREKVNLLLSRAAANLRENPFVPHPLCRHRHLQTIVASQQRRRFPWGWKNCSQETLRLKDGSEVRVKFLTIDSGRPTLMAIHGMSGSSDSAYMLALSHKAFRQGWNFLLPSLYDARKDPDSPTIFHAGCSDAVAEIIDIWTCRHDLRELALVGVSMGGNLVLKLLGEWDSRFSRTIRVAAVISPLVDLISSWPVMDKPSNLLYRLYYLRRLRRLSAAMSRFVDLEELRKVKTIKDFDELVTAPLAGFDDAFHYYREVSSLSLLPRITVPVMLLHSRDDPLLPWEPLAGPLVSGNHSLLAHLTDSGGHAGFLARKRRNDFDRSWAENRVIDFFQMALDS